MLQPLLPSEPRKHGAVQLEHIQDLCLCERQSRSVLRKPILEMF